VVEPYRGGESRSSRWHRRRTHQRQHCASGAGHFSLAVDHLNTLDLMGLNIYVDRIPEELVLAAVADGIRARENRRFEFPAAASASGTADLDCTRFHATEGVFVFHGRAQAGACPDDNAASRKRRSRWRLPSTGRGRWEMNDKPNCCARSKTATIPSSRKARFSAAM
jgi:hypothetical protein